MAWIYQNFMCAPIYKRLQQYVVNIYLLMDLLIS